MNYLTEELKNINVSDVENKIGYVFRDKSILRQAFCRSSFAYECGLKSDNEELEFIGDGALGMLVGKILSKRLLQIEDGAAHTRASKQLVRGQLWRVFEMDEAEMSKMKIKLVRRETLAAAIDELGLAEYLCLGAGDKEKKVYEEASVKEDLFESILGACALDCDWDTPTLEKVLLKMLDPIALIEQGSKDDPDYAALVENWYASKYGESIDVEEPWDTGDGTYECWVSLGKLMRSKDISARALTKEGALRLAMERAWKYICDAESLRERVLGTIGEPSLDNAVMQVNILEQKKIIPEVECHLGEWGIDKKTGNPTWMCEMDIGELGIITNGMFTFESKKEAKKHGAFALLNILVANESYSYKGVKVPASRKAMLDMINQARVAPDTKNQTQVTLSDIIERHIVELEDEEIYNLED